MINISEPLFAVADQNELEALWRVIAEAKFHPQPEDTDIWDSPYVHSLSMRVADALLDCARHTSVERAQRHLSWRASLDSNVVLPVIKMHLKNRAAGAEWRSWTMKEKTEYLRVRAAPFEVSSALATELIFEAEVQPESSLAISHPSGQDRIEAVYDGSAICVRVVGSHGDPVDMGEHEVEALIVALQDCLAKSRA